MSDQRIELAETGEEFRRIVVEDVDGEAIEYLTTLSPAEYNPVDMVRIYTLRTLIEILFRELKQYTNIENFHSESLNGVLFELFCTLIGYVLREWFRHCHPLRGGVPEAPDTLESVVTLVRLSGAFGDGIAAAVSGGSPEAGSLIFTDIST